MVKIRILYKNLDFYIIGICHCGCGEETNIYRGEYRKYIKNHGMKGIPKSEEANKKNSESHMGKIFTEEHKKKISLNHADFSGDKNGRWKSGLPKCLICGEELSWYNNIYCQTCYDGIIRWGEGNKNWKGGISFLPYCEKFNSKLKENIRKRDNYICQLCNKTQEENGRKLSIHHIHYDKENCEPDLIALCSCCNSKVNGNRNYYEKLFVNKLKERGIIKR